MGGMNISIIGKLALIFCLSVFTSFAHAKGAGNCGNNEQAKILAQLIINDERQNRATIRCNSILTEVAEAKAIKMSEIGLVVHNLGGSPNSLLEEAGYKLPKHYGNVFNSNQVEAIAGGYSDAEEVWDGFKRSEGHRIHLLGEHKFYLEQDEIGVAFIKKWESPHVEYWVVYLTQGYQKNQTSPVETDQIPNKSMFIMQQEKTKPAATSKIKTKTDN